MKKILKVSGISFGVILLILIAVPFLFKGKIVSMIKEEANKNLNATMNFDNDISLSLIRNFPRLSIVIENLSIVGKDSFDGDTLVYLPSFKASLNLMSVVKGEKIEINSIALRQPMFNLMVLPSGRANWDIAKVDTTAVEDTSASKFNLALKKFEIEDGFLSYDDKSLAFITVLRHFDHILKGDFTADNFLMETITNAKELTLGYGGVNYLYKVKADINADMDMDMKNMKFTFKDNDVLLNQLNVGWNGFVDMNDEDMDFDLTFKSKKADFKTILSLIPGIYSKSFDKATASGKLAFNGYMKGKMTDDLMPGFGLKLDIDNGFFQYPDLPKALKNVFVNLAIDNATGVMDHTIINLSRFDANIAGENLFARLLVKHPMTDPYMDGAIKGAVNLSEFRSFIPLEPATEISGLVKADVSFKGNVSTYQNNQLEKFDASGMIAAIDFHYKDPESLKQGVSIDAETAFNPQFVELKSFKGNAGMSDFDVKGTIHNLFGYMLKDELLKGDFSFNSNYFNVNEFLSDEEVKKEPVAADTIPMQAFDVPGNIDFTLNSAINTLVYDNLLLTNWKGGVLIKDKKLLFDQLFVNLLGGSMSLNGAYDSHNPAFPFSDMDLKIQSLDIVQTFNNFAMIQKLMPIAKYTHGLFNADVKLSNHYNKDLSVNYPTVNGLIQMNIADAEVKNFPVLDILANQLKMDKLRNLKMKNLNFKLNLLDGKVALDSIIVPMWEGAKARITGFSGLDQSLQYVAKLSIPRKDFGAANTALNSLTNQAKQKGVNVELSEIVDVDVLIGGFFAKPEVKISLHDAKKNLVDNLKNQLKNQADAKKEEAIAEGKRQAEIAKQKAIDSLNRVKQDAVNKLNAEKQRLEQKAEEERKKLEEQAKAEAEKVKEEAAKKAKEAAKGGIDRLLKKK